MWTAPGLRIALSNQIDDEGIVVPYSKNQRPLRISWDMLEKCFSQLSKPSGFNRAFFKEEFGHLTHDCYIHTIGQIFEKAGVAKGEKERKDNGYDSYTWIPDMYSEW